MLEGGAWNSPLVVYLGSADPITSCAASLDFVEAAGGSDRTFTSFAGAFHEVHHDEQREEVHQLVAEWILERLG
ncbi:MAG: alpha/beta hydrolase [Bacteroidota bacterium]